MSFFKTTPLREPRMEDQCGQKLNFEVPIESEPILKRKRVPWSSKYQANTCDVGRAGDVDSVKDDSENPYSVSQADRFHVVSSGMAPVFATNDLNSVSGTYLDSSQGTDEANLEDMKLSLESLKENVVTKKDFDEFMVKFNSLYEMVKNVISGTEESSQSSPIVLGLQNQLHASSLATAQMKKLCVVSHEGKEHPLLLPRSVVLRIEATSSKRGICREVLKYLHPEPHYFDFRTVTGKTKCRGKENQESPEENFEPIPALTVKYCLAVVNVVKPLDKSRFNQDVVHEELEKYDGDTMQNLSRAIIDIRKEDSRGKNKA